MKGHPLVDCVTSYMPFLVRFFAYSQIEPHNPPLLQSSVNFFEFQPCGCTAQVGYLRVNLPPLPHKAYKRTTPKFMNLGVNTKV